MRDINKFFLVVLIIAILIPIGILLNNWYNSQQYFQKRNKELEEKIKSPLRVEISHFGSVYVCGDGGGDSYRYLCKKEYCCVRAKEITGGARPMEFDFHVHYVSGNPNQKCNVEIESPSSDILITPSRLDISFPDLRFSDYGSITSGAESANVENRIFITSKTPDENILTTLTAKISCPGGTIYDTKKYIFYGED